MLWAALASGCATSGGAAAVAPAPGPAAAAGPADVYIAAAPAAPPPPSLPQFLGLDLIAGCAQKTRTEVHNTVHRLFPILSTALPDPAGPPAPIPLSSPENLDSPSPAVAAAAKIKQEEDQAQQKIVALNYLATVGCGGCYPEVEQALLAAMDDCTEDVRFAAVKAVKEAAGQPCTFCKSGACCSPAVRKKLIELSEQTDDDCCPGEPSARVRRLARIALTYCGSNGIVPLPQIEGPTPAEAWETLPPPSAAQNLTAPAAVPPVAEPVATTTDRTHTEPVDANVDELVARWYADVDPALPMSEKKRLLQAFLAEHFRRQSEQAALQHAARQEFEFHQNIQQAFAETTSSADEARKPRSIVTAAHRPGEEAVISPIRHAARILTASSPQSQPDTVPASIRVTWEEIRLPGNRQNRDADVLMMTETWRLLHGRKPDPNVKVDRSRMSIKTRNDVALTDVANAQLRNILTTLPIGECSPVIVSSDHLYLIRVLNRRSINNDHGSPSEPLDLTDGNSNP